MFKKATLAKFDWSGLPEPITDLFVENLIYQSSDRNFAVAWVKLAGAESPSELWSLYDVVTRREKLYGIPTEIQVYAAQGVPITTTDFVLYSNFKSYVNSDAWIVQSHETMLRNINRALAQHVKASELVANFYVNSDAEAKSLEKLYGGFNGIKILKRKKMLEDLNPVELVQFQITPRTEELHKLKVDIQNDCFLRLGIYTGTDKTHITDHNVEDCEQVEDLLNAYDKKLHDDFCMRYNRWIKAHGINDRVLSARLHRVTAQNSITTDETSGGREENIQEDGLVS